MSNIPAITIDILGDAAGFTAAVSAVQKGMNSIQSAVSGFAGNLSGAFGQLALPAPQIASTALAVRSIANAQKAAADSVPQTLVPGGDATLATLNAITAKFREIVALGSQARSMTAGGAVSTPLPRNTPRLTAGYGRGAAVDVDAQVIRVSPATTNTLGRIQGILSQIGQAAQAAGGRLVGVFNSAGSAGTGFRGVIASVMTGLRGLIPPANSAAAAIRDVKDETRKAGETAPPATGSIIGGFLKVAAAVGAARLAILGIKTAVNSAAAMEDIEMSFGVLLQSVGKAQTMMEELNKLDAKSPLDVTQLGAAAKTMLSFGVAANLVPAALNQLSDIAGGNAQRFESLSLAFSQTASAGKLMGQDLLQYVAAGFNPLQVISEKTGKSIADLRKDMEAGNITFAMVSDAFKTATSEGGKFFGFTDKQGQTWNGLMGQMSSAAVTLMRSIAAPIMDSLKPFLAGAVAWIKEMKPVVEGIGQSIGQSVGAVINIFKTGQIGELLEASLVSGGGRAVNALLGGVQTGFEMLSAYLVGVFKNLTDPQIWMGAIQIFQGVPQILIGAAAILGASILDGMSEVIAYLAAGMEFAADRLTSAITNVISLLKIGLLQAASMMLTALEPLAKKLGVNLQPAALATGALAKMEARNLVDREKAPKKSFGEMLGEWKETGSKGILNTDAARTEGKDMIARGTAQATAGGKDWLGAMNKNVLSPVLSAAGNYKPANVVDTSGADKKIADIFAKATPAAKAKIEKEALDGGNTAKGASKAGKVIAGDELTQIGGGGGFTGSEDAGDELLSETTQQTEVLKEIAKNTGVTGIKSNSNLGPAGELTTGGLEPSKLKTSKLDQGKLQTAGLDTTGLTTPALKTDGLQTTGLDTTANIQAGGPGEGGAVLTVLGNIYETLKTISGKIGGAGAPAGFDLKQVSA